MNQSDDLRISKTRRDIDLYEAIKIIWSSKRIIAIFLAASLLISTIYALSLKDTYTSETLLTPTQQNSSGASSLGGFSGLASLAGINLPSASPTNDVEAIEVLSSFKFFEESILPKIFLPDLMAFESWDENTNEITYNKSIWNPNSEEWQRNITSKSRRPSSQESYEVFLEKHFSISRNLDTGFVTLSIDHQSPFIAKSWLEHIVTSINQVLREDQEERALRSLEYLRTSIKSTNIPEIKQSLSSLIKQEIEKLMLIESSSDYVFKTIDPPIAPEEKSKPSRILICFIGLMIGLFLGILYSLIRELRRKSIQ